MGYKLAAPIDGTLTDYLKGLFGLKKVASLESWFNSRSEQSSGLRGFTMRRDCFVKIDTKKFRFFGFTEYVGIAATKEWPEILMTPANSAIFFEGSSEAFRAYIKRHACEGLDKIDLALALVPETDTLKIVGEVKDCYKLPFAAVAGEAVSRIVNHRKQYHERIEVRVKPGNSSRSVIEWCREQNIPVLTVVGGQLVGSRRLAGPVHFDERELTLIIRQEDAALVRVKFA